MIKTIINDIDTVNEWVGRASAWLVLGMVLIICYDVGMRYFFNQGSVALQELQWHLFALIFLLGNAYTLKHNGHVRVDVIFQSRYLSNQHRALINIFGILLFLMPFCILVLTTTWPFVENAFFYKEGSPDPGGLTHRYLLKGSILISFALLFLQGIAELLKNYLKLGQKESI
ncbi:MAG: TRAP-type mannitol/chloroaromatic compound transport system permease small subunit [Methylophagaceae bacterium]|jgi:TRAP-type mannitol/chloroaromatic compound transport system permease small subunit